MSDFRRFCIAFVVAHVLDATHALVTAHERTLGDLTKAMFAAVIVAALVVALTGKRSA